MSKLKIHEITHPNYDAESDKWYKYRLTYEGGDAFKKEYLSMFSKRETVVDYNNRYDMTYVPAHAASAIDDVKNAIFQRMSDISRVGGPDSYKRAITGEYGGVDFDGNSMDGFISRLVLPDLLVLSKIGVYVDKFPQESRTLVKSQDYRPYLYTYAAEDIRAWKYDVNNQLTTLLLRDNVDDVDEETGLVVDTIEQYRLLQKTDEGIKIAFYDSEGEYITDEIINLPKIPFVIFDINKSLMKNIADYQIALLNASSSDINYILEANFPFYTEQMDPISMLPHLRKASSTVSADDETVVHSGGTDTAAQTAKDNEIKVGATKGRRYLKNLERPGFIHPSSEPLQASMNKQEQMKQEIRQLVNLNLTNIEPRRASAEAKSFDERGLESGLSFIGMELEYGERSIADIWSLYENRAKPSQVSIHYPRKYSLKTDDEIRQEADALLKQATRVSSKTYQRETAKEVIDLTIGHKVTAQTLQEMKSEIDSSDVVITDRDVLSKDLEDGLVSADTASPACGYPANEVEKAQAERATRAAAVALAQSQAAARGVADLDPDPLKSAKNEKEQVALNEGN